jgi:hypothetical protein
MVLKIVATHLVFACFIVGAFATGGQEKDQKKRSGTIIGTLKSQKASKDGRNTIIEVLAPGEEKARSYHVMYDPQIKGPIPKVLAAVRAAKVEDVVEFEWVETGHGPAITSFRVFKKAAGGDKKEERKAEKK